jgi:hypothetical protein
MVLSQKLAQAYLACPLRPANVSYIMQEPIVIEGRLKGNDVPVHAIMEYGRVT